MDSRRLAALTAELSSTSLSRATDAVFDLHAEFDADVVVPALVSVFESSALRDPRALAVYAAAKYSRVHDDALKLGLRALEDRSQKVQLQGLYNLAYSLNTEMLPALYDFMNDSDSWLGEKARYAIWAIQEQQHVLVMADDYIGRWHELSWVVDPDNDLREPIAAPRSDPPLRGTTYDPSRLRVAAVRSVSLGQPSMWQRVAVRLRRAQS